jgi:hypothetical protein
LKRGKKAEIQSALGAKTCEVVKVVDDDNPPEKVRTFEAVCGGGFHDLSLPKQKLRRIRSILLSGPMDRRGNGRSIEPRGSLGAVAAVASQAIG